MIPSNLYENCSSPDEKKKRKGIEVTFPADNFSRRRGRNFLFLFLGGGDGSFDRVDEFREIDETFLRTTRHRGSYIRRKFAYRRTSAKHASVNAAAARATTHSYTSMRENDTDTVYIHIYIHTYIRMYLYVCIYIHVYTRTLTRNARDLIRARTSSPTNRSI